MKIVTTKKAARNGAGNVVAVGVLMDDKRHQRTVRWDHAHTPEWNHGNAAGTLLLVDSDDPILLAGEAWQHDSNDQGNIHTFSF